MNSTEFFSLLNPSQGYTAPISDKMRRNELECLTGDVSNTQQLFLEYGAIKTETEPPQNWWAKVENLKICSEIHAGNLKKLDY